MYRKVYLYFFRRKLYEYIQLSIHTLALQEIFGPVLAVHVYPDDKYKDILKLIDQTSQYGLTGAIYAEDQ